MDVRSGVKNVHFFTYFEFFVQQFIGYISPNCSIISLNKSLICLLLFSFVNLVLLEQLNNQFLIILLYVVSMNRTFSLLFPLFWKVGRGTITQMLKMPNVFGSKPIPINIMYYLFVQYSYKKRYKIINNSSCENFVRKTAPAP